VSPASILIITGYSGSGKSIALAALEDTGFYCVDNMPVALLPKFLDLATESVPEVKGFAFVMDLREKGFLGNYAEVFDSLRRQGCHLQILFLEADEKTLLQRFSQTRRQHPLASEGSVLKGIKSEKEYLQPLRQAADRIINTSHYNVHELKSVIAETTKKSRSASPIAIQILSFGYKYGPPFDADLIMDVRFLANPYFIPELKPLTGTSDPVKRFVLSDPNCTPFLTKYMDLLTFLIPLYEKEGKSYLTIAVGCTGGRHRSVAIAEYLYGQLKKPGLWISLSHRDMEQ
jgi:RNase adapter protein RapZ